MNLGTYRTSLEPGGLKCRGPLTWVQETFEKPSYEEMEYVIELKSWHLWLIYDIFRRNIWPIGIHFL